MEIEVLILGAAFIAGVLYAAVQYLWLYILFPVWVGWSRFVPYCVLVALGVALIAVNQSLSAILVGTLVAVAAFSYYIAVPMYETAVQSPSKRPRNHGLMVKYKTKILAAAGLLWLLVMAFVTVNWRLYLTAEFWILTITTAAGLVIAVAYRNK